MTRVFVTGGSGFIGSHLIPALTARGHEVVALARSDTASARLSDLGARPAPGDLSDVAAVRAMVRECDVVIHLAAPRDRHAASRHSNDGGADALPAMTRALLEALDHEVPPRMILSSSTSVYGPARRMVDENAPLAAVTANGRARVVAEQLCREAFASAPDRLVVARLTPVYGPGDPSRRQIFDAIAARRFRLIGDGEVIHHVSAVHDVVAALVACVETPDAGGSTFNVGSPPSTLRCFLETIASLCGGRVQTTPALKPFGAAVLRLLERSPTLLGRLPRVYTTLDFQLRPRIYDTAAAARCLPLPPPVAMRRVVAEALHSYGLMSLENEGAERLRVSASST